MPGAGGRAAGTEAGSTGETGSPLDSQGLCPQGLTTLPKGLQAHPLCELSRLYLLSHQGSHAAASWKPARIVPSPFDTPKPVACFCLSFQGPRFVHLQSELPQQASPPSPFPGPSFVSLPSSAPWRTPVRFSNPGEHHLLLGNPTEATILPGAPAGTGPPVRAGHVPASLLARLSVPEGRASSESL